MRIVGIAKRCWSCSVLIATFLVVPHALLGQEAETGYISVRFVDVKPDQGAQFEAAAADIGAALREGGAPFFHVYQRLRGDMGYTIITLDGNLNNMPNIELDPRLIARVTSTLDSTRLVTLEIDPALGIQSGSMEPGGRYMWVRARTTSPANAAAFLQAQEEVVVPALKAGGIKDRRFGRVVFGGNVNTFVNFTYSDTFPGTGPNMVAQAIGQREFDRMITRLNGVVSTAEDYIYLFRPDLSFTAN